MISKMRGVRGAITVEVNEREVLLSATEELLQTLVNVNAMALDDVASIIFSTTHDLTVEFPALAARRLGWNDTPLLCTHEMEVPHGMARVIRVLVHWNTTKTAQEIQHVYLRRAVALRPDKATAIALPPAPVKAQSHADPSPVILAMHPRQDAHANGNGHVTLPHHATGGDEGTTPPPFIISGILTADNNRVPRPLRAVGSVPRKGGDPMVIVVMKPGATAAQIGEVLKRIEAEGFLVHLSRSEERTIIGVIGGERPIPNRRWEALDGVEKVMQVTQPFKLASREFKSEKTTIEIGNLTIGGDEVVVMAGPCSVESYEQTMITARAVKAAGAKILRGGAFKPRSSPYDFQGLGEEGLEILAAARAETGLKIVTEVMSPDQVDLVGRYTDIFQIGARNMQNYALLHAVGEAQKPVLLKRGIAGMVKELLLCAEYILSHGNYQVMLCERGIRTYETATRNTFDINAIPVLQHLSHLPVIADPSHGVGKVEYVPAVARGAVAAGADGVILEVHPDPANALSDGQQSLTLEGFSHLMGQMRRLAEAMDRRIAPAQEPHVFGNGHLTKAHA